MRERPRAELPKGSGNERPESPPALSPAATECELQLQHMKTSEQKIAEAKRTKKMVNLFINHSTTHPHTYSMSYSFSVGTYIGPSGRKHGNCNTDYSLGQSLIVDDCEDLSTDLSEGLGAHYIFI